MNQIARTGNESIACSPARYRWTRAETDRLRELWDSDNFSCQQIAQKLGRSRNAIIGRANRIKLKQKQAGGRRPLDKWPAPWRFHFRQMWDDDVPVEQIARKFGIGPRQVYRRRKHMNLLPRENPNRRSKSRKPLPRRNIPPAPTSNPCSILEASDSRCRFPIGDPCGDGFHLCGAETDSLPPYCAYHSAVACRVDA